MTAPLPRSVEHVDLDAATRPVRPPAMVVAWRGGAPVAVRDVEPGDDPAALGAWLDGLRATTPPSAPAVSSLGVSVVVPTVVGRVDEIRALLSSLDGLRHGPLEVILVDNRRSVPEDDPLPALVAGHPRVRVVRQPVPGISAARNAGAAAARYPVVAFTDDDVQVDPSWAGALAARFEREPDLRAVTGLILPAELETPAQIWFEEHYGGFSGERTFAPVTLRPVARGGRRRRRARIEVVDARGVVQRSFALYGVGAYGAGASMAFRREALLGAGAFDEALGTGTPARGGEDLAALVGVLWAGGSIGYEPSAVVHHTHRREVAQLHHQLRGNGIGFTAMLTSLVLRDPRHLAGIGLQVPLAVVRLAQQSAARLSRRAQPAGGSTRARTAPRSLVVAELSNFALGPFAYLRSRRTRPTGTPAERSTTPTEARR